MTQNRALQPRIGQLEPSCDQPLEIGVEALIALKKRERAMKIGYGG